MKLTIQDYVDEMMYINQFVNECKVFNDVEVHPYYLTVEHTTWFKKGEMSIFCTYYENNDTISYLFLRRSDNRDLSMKFVITSRKELYEFGDKLNFLIL